ncbi:hypothetical protein [Archangium violaceum]|uniref:hypothetical protein n=1 Tax=Archangium violaceum TaxID=83451 RepID=UPI00126A3F05|nr:hypothetical protein [Archangium violaceum]
MTNRRRNPTNFPKSISVARVLDDAEARLRTVLRPDESIHTFIRDAVMAEIAKREALAPGLARPEQLPHFWLPHFWPGSSKARHTAIVFACPGQHEREQRRPVAETTGKNLNILLEFLNQRHPEIFPSTNRYDYVLANSSDQVHFNELTDDTEPENSEILTPLNVARLLRDISGCSTVLTMGRCASVALDAVVQQGFSGRVIPCNWHLSFSRLNTSIPTDAAGNEIQEEGHAATVKRIEVVAAEILAEIETQPTSGLAKT